MQYIYSRVSTDKQANENQLYSLKKSYPEAAVIEETISGTKVYKPVLEALLARLRPGDTLVIAALDRLGRRAGKAINLIDSLYERGIRVISVREGVDYGTSTGKLIGQITLAVSENERNLISERTKAALAAKKAEAMLSGNGWRCGRPNTISDITKATIFELRKQGKHIREINRLTGVSTGRISQLLKAAV